MKKIILASLLTIIYFSVCNQAVAGEWEHPWSSIKEIVVQNCMERLPLVKQIQNDCMKNEKEAYDRMQGNFGLSNPIAKKFKERCATNEKLFQVQVVCVELLVEGWNK